MTVQETTEALADRLLRELPAEEVWLFGSQARNEATPDSDMDFLVLIQESPLSGYQRSRQARELVADLPFSKDIVVLTRNEWRKQEQVVNTLPYLAKKEGRCLAAR